MQQRFSRFRPYGFFLILFIIAVCLYLTNKESASLISQPLWTNSEENVVLRLYQAPIFLYSFIQPLIPFHVFAFIFLFIGMTGMFQLLVSFKNFPTRYIPFVGSIFYVLNPITFWLFSYASFPLLCFFAMFPWQLWILLQFMHGSSMRRSTKFLFFFLIQVATGPAYSYPGCFPLLLLIISLFCAGLSLSRSFFTLLGRTPWYLFLITLLNLYWLLPRLYLFLHNNLTVNAFHNSMLQSFPQVTFPQLFSFLFQQPTPIFVLHLVFILLFMLGIIKPTRYHIPFFITSLTLALAYWLPILSSLPFLSSFITSALLPVTVFFVAAASFFFVNGLAMILAIITFIKKKKPIHHTTALPDFASLMKSPFELYQEIIDDTHTRHGAKQFTPLQFTEHFLHHLLTMKSASQKQTPQTYWPARYVCYCIFVLLILSGIVAFQGKYFGQGSLQDISPLPLNTIQTGKPSKEVAKLFRNLPNIGPAIENLAEDHVYNVHGNYITASGIPLDVYYPFRIIDGRNFSVELDQTLMKHLPDYDVESATESSTVSLLTRKGDEVTFESSSYVEINGDKLTFTFDPHLITVLTAADFHSIRCPDTTMADCYAFKHAGLPHQYAYLITLRNKTSSPLPLPFFIQNGKKTYFAGTITQKEETIVLPPSSSLGGGYTFALASSQYKDWEIAISYLPYQDMQQIRFVHKKGIPRGEMSSVPPNKTYNKILYEVQLLSLQNPAKITLAFYQSFDPGWRAYKVDPSRLKHPWDSWLVKIYPIAYAKELGTHVMVNNWANGWQLNSDWSNSTVLLIFLPQYLQYAGLVILALIFITICVSWCIGWYQRLQD